MAAPLQALDFSKGIPPFGAASPEENLQFIVTRALSEKNPIVFENLKFKIAFHLKSLPLVMAAKLEPIAACLFERTELRFEKGETLVINRELRNTLISACDYFQVLLEGRWDVDLTFSDIPKKDFELLISLIVALESDPRYNYSRYTIAETYALVYLLERFIIRDTTIKTALHHQLGIHLSTISSFSADSIDAIAKIYSDFYKDERYETKLQFCLKQMPGDALIRFFKLIDTRTIHTLHVTCHMSADDLEKLLALAPIKTLRFEGNRWAYDADLKAIRGIKEISFVKMEATEAALMQFREQNPELITFEYLYVKGMNDPFFLAIPPSLVTLHLYRDREDRFCILAEATWKRLAVLPNLSELKGSLDLKANVLAPLYPKLTCLELPSYLAPIGLDRIISIITAATKLQSLEFFLVSTLQNSEHNQAHENRTIKTLSFEINNTVELEKMLALVPELRKLTLRSRSYSDSFFSSVMRILSVKAPLLESLTLTSFCLLEWPINSLLPCLTSLDVGGSNMRDPALLDALMKMCPNLKEIRNLHYAGNTAELKKAYPKLKMTFID